MQECCVLLKRTFAQPCKNSMNLCIQTESSLTHCWADETVNCLAFVHLSGPETRHIDRCICSRNAPYSEYCMSRSCCFQIFSTIFTVFLLRCCNSKVASQFGKNHGANKYVKEGKANIFGSCILVYIYIFYKHMSFFIKLNGTGLEISAVGKMILKYSNFIWISLQQSYVNLRGPKSLE